MTEPGQSQRCKFATDDGKQCILLTTGCLFPIEPACCNFYQERETPPLDSSLVQELRGVLRYGDWGRWHIETPLHSDSIDYVFAHYVDEQVKLTIEKVRE